MKNWTEIIIREQLEHQILVELNHFSDLKQSMGIVLKILKVLSACDAVGIRLQDGTGFPFYVYDGFTNDFIEKENNICTDDPIQPFVCMCGAVLMGKAKVSSETPFFTEGGSFFSNSTSELVLKLCESEINKLKIRWNCNKEGFESVAIVPLRYNGNILGTVQYNHKEKNKFNNNAIQYLEMLGVKIGMGIWNRMLYEKLKEEVKQLRTIVYGVSNAG
jgi:hypothetical protein